MISTIFILIAGVFIYPLGIFVTYYFSSWKKMSDIYPYNPNDFEKESWMHVFGLRIDDLLLRNSSKICMSKNFLVMSQSGFGSLIAPKICVPYGDIECGNKCYVIKNSEHNVSFTLEMDSACSIVLNKKIATGSVVSDRIKVFF